MFQTTKKKIQTKFEFFFVVVPITFSPNILVYSSFDQMIFGARKFSFKTKFIKSKKKLFNNKKWKKTD